MNLVGTYAFNFERRDILRDSIENPSKKLLSFEFAQSFRIQFRASQYITGLNQTSEKKLFSFAFAQSFRIQFQPSRYITGLNWTFE